jgi:hypothetical protein
LFEGRVRRMEEGRRLRDMPFWKRKISCTKMEERWRRQYKKDAEVAGIARK